MIKNNSNINSSFNVDNTSNSNNVTLNIYEIVILIYYSLTRKKNCRLFTLIITLNEFITLISRSTKIYSRNKRYSYDLDIKFKRYYDNFSRLNFVYNSNNLSTASKATLLISNI